MDINLIRDVNDLRSRIDTVPDQHKFKKSMVGGYDTEQVEAYIKSLKKASAQEHKLFEEKQEDANSSTAMMAQERDAIAKKLSEAESKLRSFTEVTTQLENDNELLKKRIDEFILESRSAQTTEDLEKKLAEVEGENSEMSKRFNVVLESRTLAMSENTMLKDKVQDLSVTVQRISKENIELKDYIMKLKVSKRNIVVSANTSVFEYQQKHNYNVERISNNINESMVALEAMKVEMDDLYIQMQKNVENEQQ